jgi:hypothetical protein
MSDQEGTLRLQANGRWAIQCPGQMEPVAIVAGEIFEIEIRRRWWRVQTNAAGASAAVPPAARIVRGQVNRVPIRLRDGQRARVLRPGLRAAIGAEG